LQLHYLININRCTNLNNNYESHLFWIFSFSYLTGYCCIEVHQQEQCLSAIFAQVRQHVQALGHKSKGDASSWRKSVWSAEQVEVMLKSPSPVQEWPGVCKRD